MVMTLVGGTPRAATWVVAGIRKPTVGLVNDRASVNNHRLAGHKVAFLGHQEYARANQILGSLHPLDRPVWYAALVA